jgi:hypothetical protein
MATVTEEPPKPIEIVAAIQEEEAKLLFDPKKVTESELYKLSHSVLNCPRLEQHVMF